MQEKYNRILAPLDTIINTMLLVCGLTMCRWSKGARPFSWMSQQRSRTTEVQNQIPVPQPVPHCRILLQIACPV